jgi:uncharacterized protein YdiU (UPF0061 family)
MRWRARIGEERTRPAAERRAAMDAVNPAYVPRNHGIEAVIAAALADDFAPFEELMTVLSRPFEERAAFARYADPPRDHERVLATFCGT